MHRLSEREAQIQLEKKFYLHKHQRKQGTWKNLLAKGQTYFLNYNEKHRK